MPHDPALVAYTREWLVKASKDLGRIELALSTSPADPEDALFHCQQAIEKAFKGFLTWHNQAFRKVHNLGELGKQSLTIDPTLEPLVDQAASVTEYAWVFRYPGDVPEPTLEEADRGRILAREVLDAILSRLPSDVRP